MIYAKWKKYLGWQVGALLFLILSVSAPSLAQDKVRVPMCVWGMPWEDTIYVDMSIPKFEAKNPNISVDFNRYEDYWSKVVILFAAGEAPDVIRESIGASLGLHVDKNMLMPLDDYIKGPYGINKDDFVEELFEALAWAGATYYLPQDVNNPDALFYNIDLFDKAGLSYPDTSWTLKDVANTIDKLKGMTKYSIFWEDAGHLLPALTYQFGSPMWDPENLEKCLLNSPAGVEGAKLLQKWIFDEKVAPKVPLGQTRSTAMQMFMGGRLPMLFAGCWQVPSITRDAPDLNFGVTIFPRGTPDRDPGCALTSSGFSMNRKSEQPEAAWKLLRYLTSTEGLMDYWSVTYVAIPGRYSVLETPGFRRPQGLKGRVLPITSEEEFNRKLQWQVAALENKWLYFGEGTPGHPYFESRFNDMVDDLLLAGKDPKKFLDKLVELVHEDMQEAKIR